MRQVATIEIELTLHDDHENDYHDARFVIFDDLKLDTLLRKFVQMYLETRLVAKHVKVSATYTNELTMGPLATQLLEEERNT